MSILSKSKYNQSFAGERGGVSNAPHFMCENFACINKGDIYKIEGNKRIGYCVLCKACLDHYNTMYSKAGPSNTYSKLLDYISDYIRSTYGDIKYRTIMDSLNALVGGDDTIREVPAPSRIEYESIQPMPDRQSGHIDMPDVGALSDLSRLYTTDTQPLTSEMLHGWQEQITGGRIIAQGGRSPGSSRAREQYLRAIGIEEESYETATRG